MSVRRSGRCLQVVIMFVAFGLVFSVTISSSRLLAAPIGINLATSSVSITHDPLPGILAPHTVGGLGNVDVSMPLHSDLAGAAFSAGSGTISRIVSPNVFGLFFKAGTGVSQLDPASNVPSSTLRIDFRVDYLFDAGGFGFAPPWFEFATFPLVSFAGPGDLVTFSATAEFFSATLGGLIGPGVDVVFVNPGLGFLAANVSDFELATAPIPAFDTVTMFGSVIFTADNQTSEASIFLSQDGGINVPAVPQATSIALFASGLAVIAVLGDSRRRKLRSSL